MKDLNEAVARIALEVHPDRINAVCSALGLNKDPNVLGVVQGTLGPAFSPRLIKELAGALKSSTQVSSKELAAMFHASSITASLAAGTTSVELVWTGPSTGMVPVRHTEQVLTGVIDSARQKLFVVSFVAYNVGNVIDSLKQAADRGVLVRVLLEQSRLAGGKVGVDSFKMMKSEIPQARFFTWNRTEKNEAPVGSVHAKCAVADGKNAFITSANLTGAAMDWNMELGISIREGQVPLQLEKHLEALITTKQLKLV